MRTGRPPKPDHLKALAGNPGKRKPKQAGQASPVERPKEAPPAPRHLVKEARKWWEAVLPVLHREKKLSTVALPALEMAAAKYLTWRRYEAAASKLESQGLEAQAVSTGLRAAADRASSEYTRIMARFGGDPLSHGSLKGLEKPDDPEDSARASREGFFGVPGGRA